ncbi:TetR/AcrR family transcriptional regulator [Kitasatospora aureofaciens]|uniref:TetR/AcrR family transcriptional regulator n=1 Tax=Kitasatospora aureofaciens TaxID=1894 RepID=UPI001C49689F|nr:TetR/AcrR family transcriptional regulator [Kitasatospora aureofaciens]MBV6699925.1 TetR/AcrR family transcriptional regulator [Kitasatospora aureofaciens]
MSPRGVAIPDARERLFAAAERVLAREGAAGLTNRAVTEEAGCAKGLLYNHFTDLDDFVAQLVLDRFERIAVEVRPLPERAGQGDVRENLAVAALVMLGANGPAVAAAAVSRSGVAERVRQAWAGGAPGPGTVEDAMARYLEAEQRLGRIAADADCAMLALAITGTVHHFLMHGSVQPDDQSALVRRLVAALVTTAPQAD